MHVLLCHASFHRSFLCPQNQKNANGDAKTIHAMLQKTGKGNSISGSIACVSVTLTIKRRSAKKMLQVSEIGPNTVPQSSLQLPLNTTDTQNSRAFSNLQRIESTVIERAFASRAPETLLMPLSAKCLHVLANDWEIAFLALGSLSFGAFCLAFQTPCISVFLDMGHSFLELWSLSQQLLIHSSNWLLPERLTGSPHSAQKKCP